MQNRTFDPGGSQGRLRACPFLESWRVLLCGEVIRVERLGEAAAFFEGSMLRDSKPYVYR